LIKKLGDLAGEEPAADEQEPDFDFYAQHFRRPIEKNKMEAIRVLIEEGNKKMKMGSITRKMTDQVGPDA
jgi:anti-sigma28 factor (negative regulator of flagellin synthesis)